MNCNFDTPFDMVNYPFLLFFQDWFYILIWGLIVGVLFFKNKDPMLTGVVGIIIAGFFSGTSVLTSSGTGQAFNVGYLLIAISIGIVLFQIIRTRANNP